MNVGEPLAFSLPWLSCRKCGLCEDRDYVVLGRGNPEAEIMFFGEGPGPDENRLGYPFIGKAGRILNEYIEDRLHWKREDVFIDNIVACFPHNEEEGTAVIRKPSRDEIIACSNRVKETIYRVDPLLIVALGATALYGLTGINEAVKNTHGEMYMAKVPGFYKHVTYPVISTYHPAALFRTPKLAKELWNDLKFARKMLDLLRRFYTDRGGEWQ